MGTSPIDFYDKAIDVLDEAGALVQLRDKTANDQQILPVSAMDVQEVVSEWTGIPVKQLTVEETGEFTRFRTRVDEKSDWSE